MQKSLMKYRQYHSWLISLFQCKTNRILIALSFLHTCNCRNTDLIKFIHASMILKKTGCKYSVDVSLRNQNKRIDYSTQQRLFIERAGRIDLVQFPQRVLVNIIFSEGRRRAQQPRGGVREIPWRAQSATQYSATLRPNTTPPPPP